MRILMIGINDPAGTAMLFKRALESHTGHSCRVATLETRYSHAWEKDLHVPDLDASGLEELEDLLRRSDVLHFHMTADEHLQLGPFRPADYLAGKALVHHHHGHPDFRGNPEKYQDKYRRLGRKNLLVSTPDLLKKLPAARWQPNLVMVNEPRYTPPARTDADWAGPLRLAHSPTRRDLKNTDELLALAQRMGEAMRLDLIDDAPHAECLRRKKAAHACFDHMQGYYGMSSLEALSLGLATIAGLDDWCAGHIREFAGVDDLPWLVARDGDELERTLGDLARDPALRRATGEAGRRFMLERWSDEKVAQRLDGFYRTLE
ncbi:MAG: glycosyltransferase family 1 protein [Thermodesulfobacteriota bacterium]